MTLSRASHSRHRGAMCRYVEDAGTTAGATGLRRAAISASSRQTAIQRCLDNSSSGAGSVVREETGGGAGGVPIKVYVTIEVMWTRGDSLRADSGPSPGIHTIFTLRM